MIIVIIKIILIIRNIIYCKAISLYSKISGVAEPEFGSRIHEMTYVLYNIFTA